MALYKASTTLTESRIKETTIRGGALTGPTVWRREADFEQEYYAIGTTVPDSIFNLNALIEGKKGKLAEPIKVEKLESGFIDKFLSLAKKAQQLFSE